MYLLVASAPVLLPTDVEQRELALQDHHQLLLTIVVVPRPVSVTTGRVTYKKQGTPHLENAQKQGLVCSLTVFTSDCLTCFPPLSLHGIP